METKQQDKQAFFAQYWGQQVIELHDAKGKINKHCDTVCARTMKSHAFEHMKLRLKSLVDILDKDAVEVAKMAFGNCKFNSQVTITKTCNRNFGFSFKHSTHNGDYLEYQIDWGSFYDPTLICLDRTTQLQEKFHNVVGIADYLRSRSYLLPFRGYSCEELISMEWVRVKRRGVMNDSKEALQVEIF